jgi:hypothetical protein
MTKRVAGRFAVGVWGGAAAGARVPRHVCPRPRRVPGGPGTPWGHTGCCEAEGGGEAGGHQVMLPGLPPLPPATRARAHPYGNAGTGPARIPRTSPQWICARGGPKRCALRIPLAPPPPSSLCLTYTLRWFQVLGNPNSIKGAQGILHLNGRWRVHEEIVRLASQQGMVHQTFGLRPRGPVSVDYFPVWMSRHSRGGPHPMWYADRPRGQGRQAVLMVPWPRPRGLPDRRRGGGASRATKKRRRPLHNVCPPPKVRRH